MPKNNISSTLGKIFTSQRIVFWQDPAGEMLDEFRTLDLPGVEKIEIDNNEFSLKYRILRREPKQRFLIYRAGVVPADIDNWLLDVELSHGVFSADQVTLWLNEMDLGVEYGDLLREHTAFFKAASRRAALRKQIDKRDNAERFRTVMLAICCNCEAQLDAILENLLADLAENLDDRLRLIERCGLLNHLWQQVEKVYGYRSATPGLKDFVIDLFHSCYLWSVAGEKPIRNERMVFLKRWKDHVHHGKTFNRLSAKCAEWLRIEDDLRQRELHTLQEIDYFRLVDQRILKLLTERVRKQTLSFSECEDILKKRRTGHWYQDFADIYEAIYYAAAFYQQIREIELEIDSAASALKKYSLHWFKLDQLYRKFVYHAQKSGQNTLLQELSDSIENLYSNNFLLTVNNNWQAIIDDLDNWKIFGVDTQQDFFRGQVEPFYRNRKKVAVIISDALRYEIGEELVRLIQREDRYSASINPMLGMLPSCTQLGMAALLPHRELQFADDDSGTVLVDGENSRGTTCRNKILNSHTGISATTIRSEKLVSMNRDQCRQLVRENNVVYIYHNLIDAIGDKKESESRVFAAVEETFQELMRIIKKLAAANVSNMLLTADHGFLYQSRELADSDFIIDEPEAETIILHNRRYVLGKNFSPNHSCKVFAASQLGLSGELAVALPKSINRLRQPGTGSRFVHGGASLQEIILPLIKVNKKRESDTSQVDVDILQGANTIITSGQIAVIFYQRQPVSDKIHPRTLVAGIYNREGKLVSDKHDLVFDSVSENSRDREIRVRFILSREADNLDEPEVILRLDEKISGTTHFREYSSSTYKMKRSLELDDFDL